MKPFYFLILLCLLAACGGKQGSTRVVSVTIEPQRYFAEKIAGDKFDINCVVPSGQNPETYDPTPQQMVQIGKSEAYLQIGHIGFEVAWMPTIRENNKNLIFIDLSEGINLVSEGEAHGHPEQPSAGEHTEEETGEHHHHAHAGGVDPHYWSSIQGAKTIAFNTVNAFMRLDKENSDYYWQNYLILVEEIETLDTRIRRMLAPVLSRAFIIYHPSLTYFAEEFNLTQLPLEIEGKEPSPAQLKELIDLARNYNVQVVFVQQEFNRENAALIAKETGCQLVTINPLNYQWDEEMVRIAEALAHE